MLAPVTHILPLTTIRRERLLPVPGKVVVRKGQKVTAADVVAEASLFSEHLLMDIARGLGMSAGKADEYIKCRPGSQILEGDILAGPVGLAKRVVRAPHSGKVVLAGSGQVLLEKDGQPFSLKAGIPGEIVDLIPERGVIVETTGALIQCAWGNGPIDFGLLSVLAKESDQILTANQLDVSLRGSVVMAGCCESEEALKTAAELPLRGLILASMSASLAPMASRLQFPILLTEGFGRLRMNAVAFRLLSSNERREVSINAEAWDVYAGTRPELVIQLPVTAQPGLPHDADIFAPDQQVRVLREPYRSAVGRLSELRGSETFPSGVRAPAALVRLESGNTVVLPLANLEIIE